MTVKLFNVANEPEMFKALVDVWESGAIAAGEAVGKFEQRIEEYVDRPYAVSTSDMSSAIRMALRIIGVESGDEVIVSPYTCMASTSPLAELGVKVRWLDYADVGIGVDYSELERTISPRTRAVMVYHVAGYPDPSTQKIRELCDRYGVTLIEDCNNALGASYPSGHRVGGVGHYSIFSFYPNRQISMPDGGVLFCPDSSTYDRAQSLRKYGINPKSFRAKNGEINPMSDIAEIGWSCSMSNLSAAVGLSQFEQLDYKVAASQRNASLYERLLKDEAGITQIFASHTGNSVHWVYLVFVLGGQRDFLLEALKSKGVNASILHYRNDRYSCFKGCSTGGLENTSRIQREILALPCGWWLKEGDVKTVVAVIESFFSSNA